MMNSTTEPSQTALTAAAARAAHLLVDAEPVIFADTLAGELLGDRADEFVSYHLNHGAHPVLANSRTAVTTRSRYTEARLAEAAAAGVDQYLILGAGLDTFAHRAALAARLTVFELDHPATQTWKREHLAAAGIGALGEVHYLPADLEARPLGEVLADSPLDTARPVFVSWLGVSMYLTAQAVDETLARLGALARGSELVADHILPPDLRDAAGREHADAVMPFAAEQGEPWLTFLSPGQAAAALTRHGFTEVRHIRQQDTVDGPWNRTDSLRPIDLSLLAHAVVA